MSIRRINSTGRRRIARSDVAVLVQPDAEGVLEFDATLDLAGYELPADALVFVEAYRQTTFMRFPHGTVAAPMCPAGVSRRLTEFASPERLLFRVKVTSSGDRFGLLLAEADQIPVNEDEEQPEHRMPLLPPRPEDLGQEVWRVDFSGADGPYLLVNERVGIGRLSQRRRPSAHLSIPLQCGTYCGMCTRLRRSITRMTQTIGEVAGCCLRSPSRAWAGRP